MIYEFEVIENIQGKARPRMSTRTGKAYTPTKTKIYEYALRQWFIIKYPNFKPIEGRARIEITAYLEIPKSTSKAKKEEMLVNNISPTKKPDIDNIVKVVLDAMNKFAYKDDTQVVELIAKKKYAAIPKIVVKIEEF